MTEILEVSRGAAASRSVDLGYNKWEKGAASAGCILAIKEWGARAAVDSGKHRG